MRDGFLTPHAAHPGLPEVPFCLSLPFPLKHVLVDFFLLSFILYFLLGLLVGSAVGLIGNVPIFPACSTGGYEVHRVNVRAPGGGGGGGGGFSAQTHREPGSVLYLSSQVRTPCFAHFSLYLFCPERSLYSFRVR